MLLKAIDKLNPLVIRLLRSRFHWLLSPGIMLITFTGRKSGRQYTTPVGYYDIGNIILVMVSDAQNRQWWRNYRQTKPITLMLKGKTVQGMAKVLTPEDSQYKPQVETYFKRSAFIPKIFDINFDPEQGLSAEQIEKLYDYAQLVEITKQ